MQFFSFFMQQTQARAIKYFGCAEILAPTAVFVLVLGINTIAQTLVGAISDRQRLRQLLFKSIKGCFVSSPLFNYNAYFVARWRSLFFTAQTA